MKEQFVTVVSLLANTQALLDKSHTLLDLLYQKVYEQTLALSHAALSTSDFESAWHKGSTGQLETLIQFKSWELKEC